MEGYLGMNGRREKLADQNYIHYVKRENGETRWESGKVNNHMFYINRAEQSTEL